MIQSNDLADKWIKLSDHLDQGIEHQFFLIPIIIDINQYERWLVQRNVYHSDLQKKKMISKQQFPTFEVTTRRKVNSVHK